MRRTRNLFTTSAVSKSNSEVNFSLSTGIYAELNRVAKEIAETEAKILSSGFDAADVSGDNSASSVAFVDSGLSCGDHLNGVDQCDDIISAHGVINKECGTEEVTDSGHDVCIESEDDVESRVTRLPQTVYFSELQYANLTIEGHKGVVTALKDPGSRN